MIPVCVREDYGADEYMWLSPFEHHQALLDWWQNLDCADVYQHHITEILVGGELIKMTCSELYDVYDFYNKNYPSLMLDNDFSSYLFYVDRQYFHKGKRFYQPMND